MLGLARLQPVAACRDASFSYDPIHPHLGAGPRLILPNSPLSFGFHPIETREVPVLANAYLIFLTSALPLRELSHNSL